VFGKVADRWAGILAHDPRAASQATTSPAFPSGGNTG
jgi:hypothetical protein